MEKQKYYPLHKKIAGTELLGGRTKETGVGVREVGWFLLCIAYICIFFWLLFINLDWTCGGKRLMCHGMSSVVK